MKEDLCPLRDAMRGGVETAAEFALENRDPEEERNAEVRRRARNIARVRWANSVPGKCLSALTSFWK